MVFDNRHSRLVKLFRIGLPITALALLSTLFLVSDRVDPTQASLYADVDVAELAREPRIGSPQYAGVTEDGAALMVRAKAARPDPDDAGTSTEDMVAKLETRDGLVTDLTSKAGIIDPASGRISLSDGVAVQTSGGYRMSTPEIVMATDRSRLVAPKPVEAYAPFGRIDAGAMEITRPTNDRPYDLVFKGGVKLIYQPRE